MIIQSIKNRIRRIVRYTGFDIVRLEKQIGGKEPYVDMQQFLLNQNTPVILDVGGNIGQTVDKFLKMFPQSKIHSFEPSPTTYEKLKEHCAPYSSVKTWNYGVGAQEGILPFQENEHSDMSSFLSPGEFAWGKIVKTTDVQVITLDSFAEEQGIDFIHILKSDTQGYDFEVFKGAEKLMKENKIGMLYFECIFSDQYKSMSPFYEVMRYLLERNFSLVTFYDFYFQNNLISWTDVLFINKAYHQKWNEQNGGKNLIPRFKGF